MVARLAAWWHAATHLSSIPSSLAAPQLAPPPTYTSVDILANGYLISPSLNTLILIRKL
jgi:hypothetical protein